MNIILLSLLSTLAFTKKEIGGIPTLPVGDWVTENFEFIHIDTLAKSSCILSYGDGSEATTSNAYLFGDTLSLQATFYQLMPSRDTIVHRYDFLILHHQYDSLVLKPISEFAIELMGIDESMVFKRYGYDVEIEKINFEYFILKNKKLAFKIDSDREITYTVSSWTATAREYSELDWSKVGVFKGRLSEREYNEFLKYLLATGITKGNDLSNSGYCSHCLDIKLEVGIDGEIYRFRYTYPNSILYPLNRLIDQAMVHSSLKRVE